MGEPPPPPPPPGAPILLVLLSLVGSGAPGDGGPIYFQRDFPSGEHQREGYGPIPLQESKDAFTEAKRIDSSTVPDSGGLHHPIWEGYRINRFHSPRKLLHDLKRKDAVLFYHPYIHPSLQRQLIQLAQSCTPHIHLIPHRSLTREQPLALVLWDAAQQRPKVELAKDVSWLTSPPGASRLEGSRSGHQILKRATLPAKIRGFCRNHRVQDFERLFRKREQEKTSERQPLSRHRRAFLWPGQLPSLHKALGGNRHLVTLTPAHATLVTSLPVGKKDIPEPSRPGGEGHLTTPPHPGHPASLTALSTEAGTAHATGCLCPGGDLRKAQGQLGKDVKGPRRAGPRVPTPRTEEAAWAASALAFLLAVLTLAILYTRLHHKCRRGRSLYWTTADEEGHDTVATVLKRRLLSVQARRKKRPRRIQQRPLLSATSSDSSE